jgi:hypothetical protein
MTDKSRYDWDQEDVVFLDLKDAIEITTDKKAFDPNEPREPQAPPRAPSK